MTQKKDTWAVIISLWQEGKGIDPKILAHSVKRKTLLMRLMVATEVFFGFAGVAVGIWLMLMKEPSFLVGLGAFVLIFTTIGTYATVWARKGAWAAASSSVTDQLRLTLKRAHSGVRLALVNLWAIFPAGLLIGSVLFYRWEALLAAQPEKHLEIGLLVGFGILMLLGTAIWGFWYIKRKQREIVRLEQILIDLEDEQ